MNTARRSPLTPKAAATAEAQYAFAQDAYCAEKAPAEADNALVLSVVVPVRNEQDNIEPLLAELRTALEGRLEHEIIYVDDGSDDTTAARLRQAQRAYARLRVLRHGRGLGQSAALMTGARAARAPWVATLDGDGQNDPADIPRLYALLRDPARPPNLGLVVGYRRRRRDTWLKRLSSRVANGLRARVLGDRTPDTGCGLKLMRRDLYLALPFFDHMHRFLPALIQALGGATVSVAVNHRPRVRGRSNYGLHDRLWAGLVDLCGVLWLTHRMHGVAAVVDKGRGPSEEP